MYQNFCQTRLVDKIEKLFGTIPKTRTSKQSTSTIRTYDLKEETVSFIRQIDYARSRNYELRDPLQIELTSTSFFRTKEGYLRKPVKLDLKKMINEKMPEELSEAVEKRIAIFDFMGFRHQVPVKKSKLKKFSDLCNHLWTIFQE